MRPLARVVTLAAIGGLLALPAGAYVRLRTPGGTPIHWAGADIPVSFVINSTGSDDIANASEEAAIRLGFQAWEEIPGASIAFTEITDPVERARIDWDALDIHLMFFDETDASGFFPGASGTIAITPILFFTGSGEIADADILFNGQDHDFSTNGTASTFDVQGIATHEIGHFISADHSGVVGATMAPFAQFQEFGSRGLSADDIALAEDAYPSVNRGSIAGTVRRVSNNAGVGGAHVWARNMADGRVAVGAITDASGAYTITGLDAGTYRVTAEPLDGPISSVNLAGVTTETDFEPAEIGAGQVVTGSSTTNAPDLLVDADVAINVDSPATVRQIRQGQAAVPFTVFGAGLAGAIPSFPDTGAPTLTIAPGVSTAGSLSFTVTAGAAAPAGLYDLLVLNGTSAAYLAGFLEVQVPPPNATSITRDCASTLGGTAIAVTGTDFAAGAHVVFGDGVGTGTNVPNSTTIDSTAPAHAAGVVDVVVIAQDGQEDRLPTALTYGAGVDIDSIFPNIGSTAGGTEATILGSGFVDGCTVTIGGACAVTFVDSTRLDVVLPGNGLGGSPFDVTVVNPGGGPCGTFTLPGAFTVVSGSDPTITSVTPATGPYVGGTPVTIIGTGFTAPGVTVKFGADLTNGTGGVLATTTLKTTNQIDLITPPGAIGPVSILITNTTGQIAKSEPGSTPGFTYLPLLQLGDRLAGAISPAGDVDAALLDGINGTSLSISAAAASGSTLEPKLVVRSSAGTALLSTDPADPEFDPLFAFPAGTKAAIKKFILPGAEGGADAITIEISGMNGTTGAYTLKPKEKLPKSQTSIKIPTEPPTIVGPGTADLTFAAKRGSLFSAKVKAVDAGLAVEVAGFTGPSGSILGDPAVSNAIVVAPDGSSIQVTLAPLTGFGVHTFSIGATAGTGQVTGSAKSKAPKTRLQLTE